MLMPDSEECQISTWGNAPFSLSLTGSIPGELLKSFQSIQWGGFPTKFSDFGILEVWIVVSARARMHTRTPPPHTHKIPTCLVTVLVFYMAFTWRYRNVYFPLLCFKLWRTSHQGLQNHADLWLPFDMGSRTAASQLLYLLPFCHLWQWSAFSCYTVCSTWWVILFLCLLTLYPFL